MLSHFFESPTRIHETRSSPSGELIEGYADYLFQSGYAKTSARRYIRSAEHIVRWASRSGLSVSELDDTALKRFGDHLKRCRCGRYCRFNRVEILSGARLFLRHSQGLDTTVIRLSSAADSPPVLLQSFCQWISEHRGTSEPLYNYGLPIRELIRRLGEDPTKFDAQRLRKFVLNQSRHTGWGAAKRCTTALRMFLRFLIPRAGAVPGCSAPFLRWPTGA